MLKIGLTGGIGTGKTLVANYFTKLGVTVIDADQIAHKIVCPGSDLLKQITLHFGTKILNDDDTLNRKQLRKTIAYNIKEKKWLEELLHPLIYQKMEKQIAKTTSSYVILEIPLLLETNHEYFVDRILVVDAPEEVQIERIVKRDYQDEECVQKVITIQINREQRLAKANDIILNSGSKEELKNKVKELHQKYLALAKNS